MLVVDPELTLTVAVPVDSTAGDVVEFDPKDIDTSAVTVVDAEGAVALADPELALAVESIASVAAGAVVDALGA